MRLIIVQLSDIHLSTEKYPENPIMDRVGKIESAIKSLFIDDVTNCLLLVNGDISYAGLPAEYEWDLGFCRESRMPSIIHTPWTNATLSCSQETMIAISKRTMLLART